MRCALIESKMRHRQYPGQLELIGSNRLRATTCIDNPSTLSTSGRQGAQAPANSWDMQVVASGDQRQQRSRAWLHGWCCCCPKQVEILRWATSLSLRLRTSIEVVAHGKHVRTHRGYWEGAGVEPTGGVGGLLSEPHSEVGNHISGERVLCHLQRHIKSAVELGVVEYVHQLNLSTLHRACILSGDGHQKAAEQH